MAKQLGRWRMTDAPPPVGARPGAYLTSPLDDLARSRAADLRTASPRRPARPARHVHIHLPGRAKTHDQPSGASTAASAGAFPISAGETFSVSDCGDDGFSLRRVRTGDVDKDGAPTPDNVFGQEDPPGAASLDALRRRMAPRQVNDRRQPAQAEHDQLRAMQAYLNEIHRPRS
jgi:hypothetical protein